jgi:two-component system, OmpR family, sensor histidine kinase KdpD
MRHDMGTPGGRDGRPDPEALLAQVTAQERRAGRGRLRVFLGFAAGVGKTYAMLQAAHARRDEGVDVVVGWAETHGRAETGALLAGLEVLPPRVVEHRGARLADLDLDALLARRPALALVDELAHTNAPGARHAKRHQDVDELLQAGIDVYTCLNIQHVESLADVVAGITGVVVRERVPDGVLDEAAVITLIDLPPDELQQRLREGKVYVPEQAALATARFFRPGNLMALREMAIRWAARRADDEMHAYMLTHAIPGPWPAAERVLVCVGGGPRSEHLIRATRRLAGDLHAEWHAVYVETTAIDRISRANREQIWNHLALAERLGAQTATISGSAVAETLVRYARDKNVTKIVIGRTSRSRHWPWQPAPLEELIRANLAVDVVIIGETPVGATPAAAPRSPSGTARIRWRDHLAGAGIAAAVTALAFPLRGVLDPANLVMLYLVGVVLSALRWGRGPAIATAGLSVAAFDFFFVPPYLSIVVHDSQYLLTFLGLFGVGIVISTLVARVRDRQEAAREREGQTATLLGLSRDLATAADADRVAAAVRRHVRAALGCPGVLLLARGESLLPLGDADAVPLKESELAVADWAARNGRPAGRGTDTISGCDFLFLPLQAAAGSVGALGVRWPLEAGSVAPPRTLHLLEAFASQAALALERVDYAGRAQQARVLEEADRLHQAILNSLSHDLRTPLAAITGALSSLAAREAPLPETARAELLATAREEAERLNAFVSNLLDMSRLEAGTIGLRVDWHDVDDLVGSALRALGRRAATRAIVVDVPADLPLLRVDFVLLTQALVNVLDNALRYAPEGTPVTVTARAAGEMVEIAVTDRGPGIPEAEREKVFEKFHRVRREDRTSGTGLGLAICRGLVEAHGGRVWAEVAPEGGARLMLAVPAGRPGTEGAPDGASDTEEQP